MTHFLDERPLNFSKPVVRELLQVLTDTYYSGRQVRSLMQFAGISPAQVDLDQPMSRAWIDVLLVAQNQNKLRQLLGVVIESPEVAVANRIKELIAQEPLIAAPDPVGQVEWKIDPADVDGLERQLESQSTLLDISFLERGLELAPSIARLLVTLNDGQYYGTAFRIGERLLLTNHHVLFDKTGPATAVEAWFGYERSFTGADRAHTVVPCLATTIKGRADHDWAVVEVASPMPTNAGVIDLNDAASPKLLDRVYIIQHPSGGVKKIGMVHNVVVNVTDDVLQYRTDTEGGSSGSPVFNEQWQVVGLHHRWGSRMIAGRTEYFNQGRRIERVVEGLAADRLI